eukprot:182093-Hanusia_phi.AAC.1
MLPSHAKTRNHINEGRAPSTLLPTCIRTNFQRYISLCISCRYCFIPPLILSVLPSISSRAELNGQSKLKQMVKADPPQNEAWKGRAHDK